MSGAHHDSRTIDIDRLKRDARHTAAQAATFHRSAQSAKSSLLAVLAEGIERHIAADAVAGASPYLCKELTYSLVVSSTFAAIDGPPFDLTVRVGHCVSRDSGAMLSPSVARMEPYERLERPFEELLRRWAETHDDVRIAVAWPEFYEREAFCSD